MTEQDLLSTDTVVIGAGVVGLAVARRLALRGQDVILLEAGDRFGEGLSSRNSEVIHAGLYYPEDSLKARLCVQGRQALYDYCQRRGVAHRKTGKWIIATSESQRASLEALQAQAARNGVSLAAAEGGELQAALPEVRAVYGLHSPETGIIDSHGLMLSLLAELEENGGQLVCRAPVTAVHSEPGRHRVSVGGEAPCILAATRVVNAAGLAAVPLARHWTGYDPRHCPPLYYARGCYFSYSGRHPFDTLIYPVPEPGGLGVHLTLDLAGQVRFGPDVEWIGQPDFSVDPARREVFADAIRIWWPGLDPQRLQPAYAGVRPKLKGPDGGFFDFQVQDPGQHGIAGLVHLFGIESPGLTASLALAERVAEILAD